MVQKMLGSDPVYEAMVGLSPVTKQYVYNNSAFCSAHPDYGSAHPD